MNFVDVVFLVLFGLAAVKGFMKGFIIEIFSFIAFFLGLFVAIQFTSPISAKYFGDSEFKSLIAIGIFAFLFLGLTLVINLSAKVLKKAVDLTFLGTFDNILGGLTAVFKWALIISVILWILQSVGLTFQSEQIESSLIFPYIVIIGPTAFELVSNILPVFKDVFDSLDSFDSKDKWV